MELSKAKQYLELLENSLGDPDKLLSEAFYGLDDFGIVNQIRIDDLTIYEHLSSCIKKLDYFNDCTVIVSFPYVRVRLKYPKIWKTDIPYIYSLYGAEIMCLDLSNKIYYLYTSAEDDLIKVMEREITLNTYEFSEFYKRYEGICFGKRFSLARAAFMYKDRPLSMRYSNALFALFTPKRVIQKALEREKEYVDDGNERCRKLYEKQIERQQFYKENAPEFIEMMKNKKKEIADYLCSIGYTIGEEGE